MLIRRVSVVVSFLLLGCSSSGNTGTAGDGGSAGGTCQAAGARMCERACGCGPCKTGHGSPNATITLTWKNVEDCKAAYVGLACQDGGPPGVDFAACETAVDAAACTGDVFVVPSVCDPPKKDGG